MVFETIIVFIFSISLYFTMKEHFDNDVIQKLIKYYNDSLSKIIDGLRLNPNIRMYIKEDILSGALAYCYKHKSKFDPSKSNALAYFAQIFKSYVINEVRKLQTDKGRIISMNREEKLNDLLGIPNPKPTIYNI